MPIVGETVYSPWAKNPDGYGSVSWDFDFPPTNLFVKVCLADYFNYSDFGTADACIMNIRRRLPNGADETLNFPAFIQTDDERVAFYDPTMTHVTVGLFVGDAFARILVTLERWG